MGRKKLYLLSEYGQNSCNMKKKTGIAIQLEVNEALPVMLSEIVLVHTQIYFAINTLIF